MKIIIDTNGFMVPIQFGVDIFEELYRLGFNEFCVPQAVIFEIERLMRREKGSDRKAAKVARSMVDKCERIDVIGPADDVILRLAKNMGAAVLTNDRQLKRRLVDNGIKTVSLRQKNKLDIA